MSNIIFATKMQHQVVQSKSRLIVITSEPGAGATTALALKAIYTCSVGYTNAAFFVPTLHTAIAPGGIVDQIKNLLGYSIRFSARSLIFTFDNGSKLKIIPTDKSVDISYGLSRDLMLFDINIAPVFIEYHLTRAYEAVVVSRIADIEKEGSWARNLNLLSLDEGGKVLSFVDGIKHVKGCLDDNYMFNGDSDKYKELTKKYLSDSYKLEF